MSIFSYLTKKKKTEGKAFPGGASKTKEGKKYISKNTGKAEVQSRALHPKGTIWWDKTYGKTHNPNGTRK